MIAGNSSKHGQDSAVVIIGGGPCGLMLAIELGRRNVPVILLEQRASTARFPAANATQARTMEHYRRLGFAEKVRAQGLPPDYPTDIAYFTRYTKHELARFNLPSARAAREIVKTLTGSWSAAELPHRVSQMFVEAVLREEAAACPTVSIRPGWRMTALCDTGSGVEVDAEHSGGRTTLRAAYAMGADGGSSPTRKALGYGFVGEAGAVRDFMGGRMFAIHFRSAALYDVIPHPRAWMYWTVNRDRRAFMATVNGRDEFNFHTQLKPGESEQVSDAEANAMFERALAAPLKVEIIARSAWNAGYTRVAEKFQRGRIFLGGDAVHLFTPAGGLGYNTAIEDAVNLGWKLAAVVNGCAAPRLLDTYEPERIAFANRLVATTDRAFQLVTSDTPRARWVRTQVVPRVMPALFSLASMRRFMFRTISQTAIEYRASALSSGAVGEVRGGDRLPWVRPGSDTDDNFAPLVALDWQVHVYGVPAAALADLCSARGIELHAFAWREQMRAAGLTQDAAYLLRPDGYVGYAGRGADTDALGRYLDTWSLRSRALTATR
jgi:2-polyprenyl-6-methoxyphenol hydroxylase-like FAD-dependent oxidoreductase